MLNASQIKGLIPEGGSLVLNITATKDGKLSVLVNPQCPEKPAPNLSGAAGAIKAATAPRLVTGTPEELDNEFMGLLERVIESRSSLSAILESIEKETKEAIDKARAFSSTSWWTSTRTPTMRSTGWLPCCHRDTGTSVA